jgi:hypothetical protein
MGGAGEPSALRFGTYQMDSPSHSMDVKLHERNSTAERRHAGTGPP